MCVFRKKKKKNKAEEVVETLASVEEAKQQQEQKKADPRTPAQKAYDKVQRKRVSDPIHSSSVIHVHQYTHVLPNHSKPSVYWRKHRRLTNREWR